MKVIDILKECGINIRNKRKLEYDSSSKKYKYVDDETKKEIDTRIYSDDARLLMKHLNDEAIDYTIVGPLGVFSFKLRGNRIAQFKINNILFMHSFTTYIIERTDVYYSDVYDKSKRQLLNLKSPLTKQYTSDEYNKLMLLNKIKSK